MQAILAAGARGALFGGVAGVGIGLLSSQRNAGKHFLISVVASAALSILASMLGWSVVAGAVVGAFLAHHSGQKEWHQIVGGGILGACAGYAIAALVGYLAQQGIVVIL